MADPKFSIPPDPRESQLIMSYDSPHGADPDAPAGGGGAGRFTSRQPWGTGSVASLHSTTAARDAKEADWTSSLNRDFSDIVLSGNLGDYLILPMPGGG